MKPKVLNKKGYLGSRKHAQQEHKEEKIVTSFLSQDSDVWTDRVELCAVS